MSINCEQCKPLLFDLVDNRLSEPDNLSVNAHLDNCADCTQRLAGLWEMQAMSTRWEDRKVPYWNRRGFFFEPRAWFPAIQVASACASVLVLVLVLAQAQVSTEDGFSVRFGDDYALASDVERQLAEFETSQQRELDSSIDRLTARQVASNQLMLRTAIQQSRSERKADLTNLLAVLEESNDQRYEATESRLRYLVGTQIEDRRDINQLGQALRLVASDGGTL